jgi:RNA polymerase sigma-70 factor (ECF subfamily)
LLKSSGIRASTTRARPDVVARRHKAGHQACPAPQFREVLVLRELEDLSYRKMARFAGVPNGTVMSRLSRARRKATYTRGNPEQPANPNPRE